MKVETLTLGALSLVGEVRPSAVRVVVANDLGDSAIYVSATEWQSLLAVADTMRTHALIVTRLRAALKEALEMVRVGHTEERLRVLEAFLDGRREGL